MPITTPPGVSFFHNTPADPNRVSYQIDGSAGNHAATYIIDNSTKQGNTALTAGAWTHGGDVNNGLKINQNLSGPFNRGSAGSEADHGVLTLSFSAGLTDYKSIFLEAGYAPWAPPEQFRIEIPQGWSAVLISNEATVFTTPQPLTTTPIDAYGNWADFVGDYAIYNAAGIKVAHVHIEHNSNPNFGGGANVIVTCFTGDAEILCENGEIRNIADLKEGDLVQTRHNGLKPIRWIGSTKVGAESLSQFPEFRPVRFRKNALGEHDELTLSQQHRVLIDDWRAEVLFGEDSVLVAAKHLLNDSTITVDQDVDEVEYFHILFDDHEVIQANGMWSESFQPGKHAVDHMEEPLRREIVSFFPELDYESGVSRVQSAHASLRKKEVRVLSPGGYEL